MSKISPEERELFIAFQNEFLEMKSQKIPVVLNIDLPTAWALLSTIQLACRHPNFDGDTRRLAETTARMLQDAMNLPPAMAEIAEKGWSREFDK